MHMADALISPAVGGTMWIVTAGLIAYCARKLKQTMKDNLVPMMGVLGAFIFAAQMINFSIPGTGSSGHLGGALILSILLGPYAAFLVIASVLTVQAFFFADGGLLALGCNIFNLGFYPAFIAYPFIYRVISREEPWSPPAPPKAGKPWSPLLGGQAVAPPLAGSPAVAIKAKAGKPGTSRAWIAAIVAAVVGLQLGAFSVVLETRASGISELPFGAFVLLMLPIHLAIGIVEGLATVAVVSFVVRARPETLNTATESKSNLQPVLIGLVIAAVIIGGAVSWFASTHPDGLEWSIAKVTSKEEFSGSKDGLHKNLDQLQEKTSFLPDYDFNVNREKDGIVVGQLSGAVARPLRGRVFLPAEPSRRSATATHNPDPLHGIAAEVKWPDIKAGTSVSGIVGGLLTLVMACLAGFVLKARRATV